MEYEDFAAFGVTKRADFDTEKMYWQGLLTGDPVWGPGDRIECSSPKRASASKQPMTTIGRSPENDLVVDDLIDVLQTRQARALDKRPLLTDLNSTNGTFVNGERISSSTVAEGDLIVFGQAQFRLTSGGLVPAKDAPPTGRSGRWKIGALVGCAVVAALAVVAAVVLTSGSDEDIAAPSVLLTRAVRNNRLTYMRLLPL